MAAKHKIGDSIAIGDKVRIGSDVGEVIKIEDHGKANSYRVYFQEEGLRTYFSPPTTLEKISDPLTKLKSLDFDPEYKFDLLTRATQLSLAFEYDHLLSLSNSRTNLEPYQVECVHKIINSFQQRFLIADDVGLGKTIEAAMVLKELAARDRAKRVLILAPASLTTQWQREMRGKVDEHFWIYDSDKLKELKKSIPKDMNAWEYEDKIITSLDFAKQEHVLAALEQAQWDLIIFDEAHKLSVEPDGTQTQRYKLGRAIADKTENILLLSATPHKGERMAFWRLVQLIDPYLFKDKDHIDPDKLDAVMIRRGKDRLRNEDGSKVFKPREVDSVPVKFTQEEMELYEAVTDYVHKEYNLAKGEGNKAVGFAMIILQKRMVSSIYALKRSLENRLRKLKEARDKDVDEKYQKKYEEFLKDPDSLEDGEREELERLLETATFALDPESREVEIKKLEELIVLANRIKTDSKAAALKTYVDDLFKKKPNEKLLIFTEYRDTLEYLRDQVLKEYKKDITEIHGEVPMAIRQEREKLFADDMRIMMATDAAGEGINLQFCHLMVNYELPWNPNRLDQRIGRLHRYGQKRKVYVHNLLVRDTREGQIFLRLQEKMKQIEQDLKGKVSDVLGSLLEGMPLEDLLVNALAEDTPIHVGEKDIEEALEDRKRMVLQAESLLMKLHKFDLNGALNLIRRSEEVTFTNEDIEQFVRAFFQTHNGKIEPTRYKQQFRLYPPVEVQVERQVPKKIERATFDKEIAKSLSPDECEFVAFGHPLLEQIIKYCTDRDGHFGGSATVKTISSNERPDKPGVLFNFLIRFLDGEGKAISEQIISAFASEDGTIDISEIDPSPLLSNLQPNEPPPEEVNRLTERADELFQHALNEAQGYAQKKVKRAQGQREREVQIRLQDAERYFAPRIEQEHKRIKEFEKRQREGNDMRVAIRAAESRIHSYQDEWKLRQAQLDQKRQVFVEGPELLNCAITLPSA